MHMYNESQINRIKETLKELIYFFGYANNPNEENKTSFFNYDFKEL